MDARFTIATDSHRANTEDRAMVLPVEDGAILCIADGTGGLPGGARAAELFVERVRCAALAPSFAQGDPDAWSALLESIDIHIAADRMAGETTGIAIAVIENRLVGASSGDSRAYLVAASGWRELTAGQCRKPRLGTGRARPKSFEAKARGVLVAGTDGLFDYAEFDDISRVVLSMPDEAVGALVRLVRDRHRRLPDDIAVVVGRLGAG